MVSFKVQTFLKEFYFKVCTPFQSYVPNGAGDESFDNGYEYGSIPKYPHQVCKEF